MRLGRRGLLAGLFAAPAIIRTPGLLMAVKPLYRPEDIQRLLERRIREAEKLMRANIYCSLYSEASRFDLSNFLTSMLGNATYESPDYIEMGAYEFEQLSTSVVGV